MKTVWISLLTSAGFIGLITLIFRIFAENSIKTIFQKMIEKYKHKLNLIIEKSKFEFQRKITDFTLSIELKHSIYAKLFELIQIANGMLEGLIGFRPVPSFEEYGKDDIVKYLEDHEIVKGMIVELTEDWEKENKRSIEKIKEYLYMIDFQKANNARIDANNYFSKKLLYISDELELLIKDFFLSLAKMHVDWETQIVRKYHHKNIKEIFEEGKKKNELLKKIKDKMKGELSIDTSDYFNKTDSPSEKQEKD